MTKVATACILVVLALCAVVLLASAQGVSQSLGTPYGVSGHVNPYWRPRPPYRRRCQQTEIYLRCQSSSCGERRCSDLFRRPTRPRICTADCVSRCFCRHGLFRNHRGRCVRRRQCKKTRPAPLPVPRRPTAVRPE
uniref:Putative tick til 1 n=1 Tax=Amblyomma triste TaxID=251400 RepID=A0A023G9L3_AMBTT